VYFSGIADEAGSGIDEQIAAHKELGWDHIELRMVDGTNITQVDDEAFKVIADKLGEAGMQCSCFGSAIANWARPITKDPQADYDDLRHSIPRMQQLNCPFIRVMSYPNDTDNPIPEDEWRKESIFRMRTLAQMAEDGGVTLVHENCSGWGGLSAENSNILLGEVNSPALKVVFDTGNPVTYGQDSWEYYKTVEKDIAYVHVKDAKGSAKEGEEEYTYCGEGDGHVKDILADLLGKGYDSGVSIEPHLAAVIHTGERTSEAQKLHDTYVEYGRRLMAIVDDITAAKA